MDIYFHLSQIGLCLDFFGAWLIYEYDLKETGDRYGEKTKRRFKHFGFFLIFIGFILQLVEPWCDNDGKLFRINTHIPDQGLNI